MNEKLIIQTKSLLRWLCL